MNIALIAVDSTFPNLALMKIARYHRDRGDTVEWYTPFDEYDKVYMAKVFSYTEDYGQYITNAKEIIKGGTGYDLTTTLPDEIDRLQPDYSIYPSVDKKTAYGFLTRGCPNRCKWCVVPKKEGKEIYEGDIILEKLKRSRKDGDLHEIVFEDCQWFGKNKDGAATSLSLLNDFHVIKIIGNIHDNPEILKGGEK